MPAKRVKTVLAALLLMASLLIPATAELTVDKNSQSSCASETLLYVLQAENTGTSSETYTASLSGEASDWAVIVPQGFSLAAGETKTLYLYVTSPLDVTEKDYSLKATLVGDKSGRQELPLIVGVEACHSLSLTAKEADKKTCACIQTNYELTLENTGKYTETTRLSLAGNTGRWAAISDEAVSLAPEDSKSITVFATPPCEAIGDYEITITAKSTDSRALASQKLALKSESCYDFDVLPDKNYVSACEGSEAKIPIVIKNKGGIDNSYSLMVDGPGWASIENAKVTISANSEKSVNLILLPPYKTLGTQDFDVKVTPEKGGQASKKTIAANILGCHKTSLKFAESSGQLCPGIAGEYKLQLANQGEFTEHYALSIEGPEWASMEGRLVDLAAGDSKELKLVLKPKLDLAEGEYQIKVSAESQDSCKSSASDAFRIKIIPRADCFGMKLSTEQARVSLSRGEGQLIPLKLENRGLQASTYVFAAIGSGAAFVRINPAIITIEGKKSDLVYAYAAIPESAQQTIYPVKIIAKQKDSELADSANIELRLLAPGEKSETPAEVVSPSSEVPAAAKPLISFSGFAVVKPAIKQVLVKLGARQIRDYGCAVRAKLSGITAGGLKLKLVSVAKNSYYEVRGRLSVIKNWFFQKTYDAENWKICVGVIVLLVFTYVIFRKPEFDKPSLWDKFVKWLEEEDEEFLEGEKKETEESKAGEKPGKKSKKQET